jgi:hypothetical protein
MGKQNKYTKSARNQDCQVRMPFVCNYRTETTVFAHRNGGGMGTKNLDIHGSYACSDCHDVYDGRVKTDYSKEEVETWFDDGIFRTQEIMVKNGVLKL